MAKPWPSPACKTIQKADQVALLEVHKRQCLLRQPIPAPQDQAAPQFVPGYREIKLSKAINRASTGQGGIGLVSPPTADKYERASRLLQAEWKRRRRVP